MWRAEGSITPEASLARGRFVRALLTPKQRFFKGGVFKMDMESPAVAGESECSGHPMFPLPEGERGPETRRIDRILIDRYGPDGQRESCPRAFRAHELQSWADVVELYGGGTYQARAQCGTTFRLQGTTEKVHFASPAPRPFSGERSGPASSSSAAAAASSSAASTESSANSPASSGAPARAAAAVASPVAPLAQHPLAMSLGALGYAPPLGALGYAPPPAPAPAPQGSGVDLTAILLGLLNRPPPPPPVAPAAPDSITPLIAAMLKASAETQSILMRALVERAAVPAPPAAAAPNALEMLRELKPLFSGGGGETANVLLQGVELAKGLYQTTATAAAAAPAPQDDLGATLGAIMKVMAQSSAQSSAPAPAAPAAAAPSAPSAPPPPAPGWAWARTPEGAFVQVPVAPVAAPMVSAPPPPPVAPAALTADQLEQALAVALTRPELRARLRMALDAAEPRAVAPAAVYAPPAVAAPPPAPVYAPPAVAAPPPAPVAPPVSNDNNNTSPLVADLDAFAPLLAGVSNLPVEVRDHLLSALASAASARGGAMFDSGGNVLEFLSDPAVAEALQQAGQAEPGLMAALADVMPKVGGAMA
jgi:hypothetical protein